VLLIRTHPNPLPSERNSDTYQNSRENGEGANTLQKILVNSKALGMYRLKTSIKYITKRNEEKKL
jgi:hypothetical protein